MAAAGSTLNGAWKTSVATISVLGILWVCRNSASTTTPTDGGFKTANGKKPNILLLLADDLGYGEMEGFFFDQPPGKTVYTPELVKLQQQGVKFTDFYSGEAVCSPARCTLFTGKHTGHATVRGNAKGPDGYDFPLKPEDVTISQLLQNAGYTTGMVGKWCFGGETSHSSPWKKGFEYFFGHLYQTAAHNMYPRYLWEKWGHKQGAHKVSYPENSNATRARCMQRDSTCSYSHSSFVDRALDFLDTQSSSEAPFFLFVSFTVPHAGGWEGQGINDRFEETGNPVPSDGRYADKADWLTVERDHAASITEYLDKDAGRLLAKLDELGIANDTLVLFSSDNGPHNEGGHDVHFFQSSGPFRGFKRSLYEGGIRVPFIARWPGEIKANETKGDAAWFPDLLATLAEAAGIEELVPDDTDGHSLISLLTGKGSPSPPPDRIFYWEFCTNGMWGQAVRWREFKLICLDRPNSPWELYNLTSDPSESISLANDADLAGVVKRLEAEAQAAHVDDPHWPTGRSCFPSDSWERSISFALQFS